MKIKSPRYSVVHFFYPKYDVELPKLDSALRQKYSVFANQAESSGTDAKDEEKAANKKFGDLMAEKWVQVARG